MSKDESKAKRIDQILVSIMVLSILCFLPIYTEDGFFGSQIAKLNLFLTTIAIVGGMLILARLLHPKEYYINYKDREKRPWQNGEWFFAMFIVVSIISTLLSEFPKEAFTGFREGVRTGRVQGLGILLLYGLTYFLIRRKLYLREYLFDLFLLFGSVPCILAILNGYGLDPLGFYDNVNLESKTTFISTIGNINTFSSYAIMIVVLTIYLSVYTKNQKKQYIYQSSLFINGAALIISRSDSGLFALGIVVVLMAYYFASSKTSFLRLIEALLILNMSFIIIGITVPNIDGLWGKIGNYQGWIILWVACWLIYAICARVDVERHLQKIIVISSLFSVIIIIGIIIGVNSFGIRLGGFEEVFNFTGHWGSGRKEIYSTAIELFNNFNIREKLVGSGPDTYGLLTLSKEVPYGTSAHSEYLQYLITVGLLGLITYVALLISLLKRGFKSKNGLLIGASFVVLSYALQATFNIGQIYTTPIFFIFLGFLATKGGKTQSNGT